MFAMMLQQRNTMSKLHAIQLVILCVVQLVPALAQAGPATGTQQAHPAGLTTLYALDPLTQSFCFTRNCEGGVIKDNTLLNSGSEIDFGNFSPNSFTCGVSVGTTAAIVDIGTAENLETEYGYHETMGNGQGYASIRLAEKTLKIKSKSDDDNSEGQELKEGVQIMRGLKKLAEARVALGHIYLLHTSSPSPEPTDAFVKMLVVAYQPDQFVTIRWEVLGQE